MTYKVRIQILRQMYISFGVLVTVVIILALTNVGSFEPLSLLYGEYFLPYSQKAGIMHGVIWFGLISVTSFTYLRLRIAKSDATNLSTYFKLEPDTFALVASVILAALISNIGAMVNSHDLFWNGILFVVPFAYGGWIIIRFSWKWISRLFVYCPSCETKDGKRKPMLIWNAKTEEHFVETVSQDKVKTWTNESVSAKHYDSRGLEIGTSSSSQRIPVTRKTTVTKWKNHYECPKCGHKWYDFDLRQQTSEQYR